MKLVAVILSALCLSSALYREPIPESVEPAPRELTLYEAATLGTDIPPDLFRALAMAESDEMDSATGDDGASIGRFQLNETFRAERVRIYGEYDPRNPVQAARVAAGILQSYFERFGNWPLALTAYNGGPGYVLSKGRRMAYINRVQMMLERLGSRFEIIHYAKGLVK